MIFGQDNKVKFAPADVVTPLVYEYICTAVGQRESHVCSTFEGLQKCALYKYSYTDNVTQGGNFNVSPLYSWSGATRLGGNLLFVTYFKAQPCKDVFLQAPNDRNRNLKASKVPLESQM